MTDSSDKRGAQFHKSSDSTGERLVFVVPEPSAIGPAMRELTIRHFFLHLWSGKWIILMFVLVFAAGSVAYALAQTEWYRAEVLLAPADERAMPSLGGQLGGLAALAGVSVGGGGGAEAVAVLKTRDFARSFIEEFDLITVFFASEWDLEGNRWRGDDPSQWPDVRDAIRFFHEKILKVSEDRQSGLVTLAVEWTEPETAAIWADTLARRLNSRMRDQALREAQSNVAYLQEELAKTNVVTLQQSIGRLLENELQKLMLARGNEEFAFRIIDPAEIPRKRIRPVRSLIAVMGTMVGGLFGIFVVFFLQAIRRRPDDNQREVGSP